MFSIQAGSYPTIILLLVLSGAGLPLPEEAVVVTAGVLAAHGHLNSWLAWGSCLLGAMGGDLALYFIGRKFGREVLSRQRWWARFFRRKRKERFEELLRRHSYKLLFVARFLVGVRSSVYLTAGILHVPFWGFFIADLICATTVITLSYVVAFRYGREIAAWVGRVELLLTIAVVLCLVGLCVYVWRNYRRRIFAILFYARYSRERRKDSG